MVRAVDLQDNYSKAPLAARLQHIQQTRADLMQFQLNRQAAQEHILEHSRTLPILPTLQAALHPDTKNPPTKARLRPTRRQPTVSTKQKTRKEENTEDRPHCIDLMA